MTVTLVTPATGRPGNDLVGKHILLVDPDRFSAAYVAAALTSNGARVLGPFVRLDEAGPHLAGDVEPDLAVIGSCALEPAGWAALAALHRASVPTLFLRDGSDDWLGLLRCARWLDRPFAAHQVAECLGSTMTLRP